MRPKYFRERDKKYGMTGLSLLVVVQPHTADDAASSVPTTFSEPLETPAIVPRKLQIAQVTSQPGNRQMRLRSQKPETHARILSLLPAQMPDWSQFQ